MNLLMTLLIKYCPFLVAFANEAAAGTGVQVQTPSFINNILGWVAGLGGGIIAIFIVVSLVKDGIEYSKGQGSTSIWKILGKVLFLLIILGLIFLATNYSSLGNTAKNIGNNGINVITNETNKLIK